MKLTKNFKQRTKRLGCVLSELTKQNKGKAVFLPANLIWRHIFSEFRQNENGDIGDMCCLLSEDQWTWAFAALSHDETGQTGIYTAAVDDLFHAIINNTNELQSELRAAQPKVVSEKQLEKAIKKIKKAETMVGICRGI